jgi:hypothetical protein
MAELAKKPNKSGRVSGFLEATKPNSSEIVVKPTRIEVQRTAARLYSQGYKRSQIARLLMTHLTPAMDGKPTEQRLSNARRKLRGWERSKKFRDYIYQLGIISADIEIPDVFKGVIKQAKKGRVDAARLMLEVTGRHSTKGERGDTTVVVAFDGHIPRPVRAIGNGDQDTVDGEAEEQYD